MDTKAMKDKPETVDVGALTPEARDVYFNMSRALRARDSYISVLEKKTTELESLAAAKEQHISALQAHISAVDEYYGLRVPMLKLILRHLAHRWFPPHTVRGQRARGVARKVFRMVGLK